MVDPQGSLSDHNGVAWAEIYPHSTGPTTTTGRETKKLVDESREDLAVHIRADRDDLAEAFGRANRGAGVKTALPTLQGVRCQAEDGQLEITGSDTEVTIRTSAKVEVIEAGAFLVPGRVMTDAIRRMPEGAVSIRSEEGAIELSGNGPTFTIRLLSLEDYPKLPEPDLTGAIELDGNLLVEALSQVLVAASNDASRPILTGVLMENYEEGLRLVATDSYRLAIRNLPGLEVGDAALIPARGLKELARTVAAEQVRVAIREREVVFASDRGSLSIRLIEGTFPNYRQLLPDDYPAAVELDKDRMLEAVSRASVVADEHIPVRLNITPDGVEMSVSRNDLGGEVEMLEATVSGELDELNIAFNSRYLHDGITAVPGPRIRMEVKDSNRPSIIRADGSQTFRYLLMPVRV